MWSAWCCSVASVSASNAPRVRGAASGEPVNTSPQDSGSHILAARPSEYEAATMRWLSGTVEMLMRARDPVYAQMGSEPVESVPDTAVELPGGQDMIVAPLPTTAAGSIEIEPVITGDFDDLHAEVSSIADQRLEQTMGAFFALLTDITQRTGNVVDANGDAAEGLLALMEKTDIDFDEDGNPALQLIVSPADAARVRAQLAAFTPDQQRRFADIISRKREAYRASRRRRRLPRHGH